MQLDVFLSLPSWSVNYDGNVFDDARRIDGGLWHYRDVITRAIHSFSDQERVVVISQKPISKSTTDALGVSYTLFTSIVGMFLDEHMVTTLPVGAVLEAATPVAAVGIVQVRYDGRLMHVFATDLLESGRLGSS